MYTGFDSNPTTPEQILADLQRRIDVTKMDLEDDIYEKSTIVPFFRGKCVLVTGGAGFLGQLYIEKLLRYDVSHFLHHSILLICQSKIKWYSM